MNKDEFTLVYTTEQGGRFHYLHHVHSLQLPDGLIYDATLARTGINWGYRGTQGVLWPDEATNAENLRRQAKREGE